MSANYSLLALLNLVGAVQSFLLALALLGLKRGRRGTRITLAALLCAFSLLICGSILSHTRYVLALPHLAQVHIPFQFVVAPLLFIYLKTLTQTDAKLDGRTLLHFLPFALCVLYLLPFYLQSSDHKVALLMATFVAFPPAWYVRMALLLLQAGVYLALSLRLVAGHAHGDGRTRVAARQNRTWLWTLLLLAALIWAAAALRYLFAFRVETNLFVPLLLSVFTYVMFYAGLRQPEIWTGAGALLQTRKYETSSLMPVRAERYLQRLMELMERERPYLDGELTLAKLAARLGMPPHQLSQLVNDRLGQNFLEFVNGFRLAEAKRRLVDPAKKHYSIMAIAHECGFNSKSTFNTVFKRHTEMTPSEFRRRHDGHS